MAEEKSDAGWRYFIWLLVLLLIGAYWLSLQDGATAQEVIPYTAFKEAVRQDRVAEVTIRGQEVTGTLVAERNDEPAQVFSTTIPPIEDSALMELLESRNVIVQVEPEGTPWWQQMLIALLPWLLIFFLIFWVIRRMQDRMAAGSRGDGMFGFGKSKAKRFRKEMTNITFDDIAGLENAKKDLHEIVDYLKEPDRYRSLGAKIPKGILLMGPPGTGKTLLAKGVAGEADVPFFSISGSEFIEMFVGVGAARVRDLFESAKKESPSIIFIDELDSVGRARGTGLGGGHDEREQTLNQILSEMDGFEPHQAVVVLAATNRPDVLDKALMRPGRFDRKVTLELPRRPARRKIFEVHTRRVPLANDVDLDVLAARTVGFSGADIENLVNEAALLAGRDRRHDVDMQTFSNARDKIVLGVERDTFSSEEERRVVAYHESGHALMARLLPHADPLDKVTIIPRGQALGVTEQTPEEDRLNLRRSYLLDRIGVMLGGRVSEQVVFGEESTGAESDLKQATYVARRMVSNWGMSARIGPIAFRRGEEHVFLGREMAQERDYSEHTAELIDEEVRRIIVESEERVRGLMEDHRSDLDKLAQALVEKEILDSADIDRLLGHPPVPPPDRTYGPNPIGA